MTGQREVSGRTEGGGTEGGCDRTEGGVAGRREVSGRTEGG